jgi:hypothetical protein
MKIVAKRLIAVYYEKYNSINYRLSHFSLSLVNSPLKANSSLLMRCCSCLMSSSLLAIA